MNLAELHNIADYKDKNGMIFNADCIDIMSKMDDNCVDFTLTDIPYDAVNRASNGLRNLDKDKADIITFNLDKFLNEIYRVSSNSICVFCGWGQFSQITNFFSDKKGTVRPIIWEKSNPSPMNGQHIYLSGVEIGVWFKRSGGGGVFNAHCKNPVFHYPNGRSKLHPTEKNHDLLADLINDNSNEGQIIFDPCCGSGAHCLVAKKLNRRFVGIELDKGYFIKATNRLNEDNNNA